MACVLSEEHQQKLWPSVAEFFVYDEVLYQAMTSDESRNESYRVAIRQTVKDKVVLDIGTGRDAILARICAEEGARRVYAVDVLEESYQQARACVKALELEQQIIVLYGDTTSIELPEPIDVCVSEIVGAIGGSEGAAHILNNAQRFFAEGTGIMIPQCSVTRIAAVSLPDELLVEPSFSDLSAHYVERIFEQVGARFDLRLCVKNISSEDLLSNVGIFEDLDFREIVAESEQHDCLLEIKRTGRLDGLLLWLHLETIEGEEIDALLEEHCWLPVYLPVCYPGEDVNEGDRIELRCSRKPSENGRNPDYRVEGRLIRNAGGERTFVYEAPHDERGFCQTAFYQAAFPGGKPRSKRKERSGETLTSTRLQEYLRRLLPEYMLPSAYVQLEALPRLTSRKIDRKALSFPLVHEESSSAVIGAVCSPIEELLLELWRQVLGPIHIDIHDNFFDLGGHSLLATQVISRMKAVLHVDLPLRSLFEAPTIVALAGLVEQALRGAGSLKEPPLVPVSRTQELPLSFAQQRLWFLDQLEPESPAYLVPSVLSIAGRVDVHALERSVQELVRRHESLRTTFPSQAGHAMQVIHQSVGIPCR